MTRAPASEREAARKMQRSVYATLSRERFDADAVANRRLARIIVADLAAALAAHPTLPPPLDVDRLRIAVMRALEQTDNPHSPWPAFADRVIAEYVAHAWLPVATPSPDAGEPHQPGEFHTYRQLECEVCGQRGQVVVSIEPQRADPQSPTGGGS